MVPGKGLWSRVGSVWGFALLVAGFVQSKPVMREEEWNKFYYNFYFCWRDQAMFGRTENFKSEVKEKDEWKGNFFFFFFFNGKGWVEFGYIVFGLNGFLVKT